MRKLTLFVFILGWVSVFAQYDTIPKGKTWKIGLEAQTIMGSRGGAAYAGQLSVRYKIWEMGLASGYNEREVQRRGSFDQVTAKGYWIEPNISVETPIGTWSKEETALGPTVLYGYVKASYGFCKMDNTFTTFFETSSPYQPFIYQKKYENTKSNYVSTIAGSRLEINNRVRFGYGLGLFWAYEKREYIDGSYRKPAMYSPINGDSIFIFVLSMGVML